MGSVNDVKQFGNNRRTHVPYLGFPPKGSKLNQKPDTPTNLVAATIDATSIGLTWDSVTDVDSYKVYYGTDGTTFGSSANAASNSATIGSLTTSNQHYYFYVVSIKDSKESLPSTTASNELPLGVYDGTGVAWYDYQATDTLTDDGGGLISKWADKLATGHDLIAAGTARPTKTVNGILFDGVANYMKTAAFTFNRPEYIYMLLRQKTWTDNDRIFDGYTNSSGSVLQSGTTPKIAINAGGGNVGNTAGMTLDEFCVLRVEFSGSNSLIQINDLTATTNAGVSNNMGGITIGKIGGASLYYSNIEVKEAFFRTSPCTAILDYLKKKNS